jgi:formate dehydrogenase maturation protein FdhE
MGSAGAKMESNMQPLVGMWLTITSATDAQNASLTRQLELMGKLTDAQNAVLDKAKGWKDYLAQLVDGYNTGVESLGVYVEQLGSFRTSLSTLFAGAQGDARAAIQEMIDMINKLMATAGSTPASNAQGDYATRTLGQTFG